MRWLWIQLILFQCLWFITILGQNQWLPGAIIFLLCHFIFTDSRYLDWRALPIALIGILMDSLLTASGVFHFDHTPYWLALLWIGFILSLGHSLKWLDHLPRPLLIPIGAIAGTLSYIAGWKLDAVVLPLGAMQSSLILALCWGVLLPLLVMLNNKVRRKA